MFDEQQAADSPRPSRSRGRLLARRVIDRRASSDVFRPVPSRRRVWRRLIRHADVLGVVALGGAVGSAGKHAVGLALPTSSGGFPWATFLVNITGCFMLGLLMVVLTEIWRRGRYLRPFLGVGVLGGYTTFSTVTTETLTLAREGQWLLTNSYLLDTMIAGLAAVWLGVIIARAATRRPIRHNRAGATSSGNDTTTDRRAHTSTDGERQ